MKACGFVDSGTVAYATCDTAVSQPVISCTPIIACGYDWFDWFCWCSPFSLLPTPYTLAKRSLAHSSLFILNS